MSAHSAEDVRKSVKVYMMVFTILMVLTFVTVAISRIHLPTHWAVFLALAVAGTKGTLVGLFFMHLSDEKRIIYGTLLLTLIFFIFLMAISFFA